MKGYQDKIPIKFQIKHKMLEKCSMPGIISRKKNRVDVPYSEFFWFPMMGLWSQNISTDSLSTDAAWPTEYF